ncbi:anthranilate synthase component I family protein [Acetivibrio saccincola]|jgi:para-aminobenzoate synthetase component 1|uniref:anthranilate synthase component I family protein n=1 Tax=Acetivibrio saccincola TaxID=1677857 RepID=UPI00235573AA|nr:anthranilate synthase component I family protein [Acetivibrio saccincola]HQD29812.1 anthranilate synthase component I family protein [Acetivibrio saccincola]
MTIQFHIKTLCTSLDAFQIYKLVAKGEDYIFLDSSKKELPYGGYSIIGINPFLTVKYENNCIYEKTSGEFFSPLGKYKNIFNYLKEKIQKYKLNNPTDLPFVGGAIGYFSYDFGCRLKNIPLPSEQIAAIPEVYFVFYDNAIIIDHKTGQVSVTGLGILQDAKKSVDALVCEIKDNRYAEKNQEAFEKSIHTPFFKSCFSKKDYIKAIEKMQNYIHKGDIFLANMTHTFSSIFQNNPQSTYENLRRINPAPFSAYLPLDGFHVLCSSPERFLKVRNGNVETRPIKGTIPRGQTPQEDEINRCILENSEKDKSELAIITKLEKNDLMRVCKPDTVKAKELFKIEAFATVFHLVSTVVGTLKDNCTCVDCMETMFPGGSITGAPKLRSMEIISELERNQRNLYTGSIGYFGFDGNADFNVVIRSILIKDNYAHIGVGGGITSQSNPQWEYNETIAKAIALFNSLKAEYFV